MTALRYMFVTPNAQLIWKLSANDNQSSYQHHSINLIAIFQETT